MRFAHHEYRSPTAAVLPEAPLQWPAECLELRGVAAARTGYYRISSVGPGVPRERWLSGRKRGFAKPVTG